MTFKELQSFLKEEQADSRADDPNYVNSLFRDFARAPNRFRDSRQPSLTLPEVGMCVWALRGGFPPCLAHPHLALGLPLSAGA